MNSNIQASFFYSHLRDSNIEDTHFKTITRLKVSSPDDILETLFLNLSNNIVGISKDYISTYLNKHISTHFTNEDIDENIEEHIIRHNDNFLVFSFDSSDETVSIKYLSHTEEDPLVYSPDFRHTPVLRETYHFDEKVENKSVENTKTKKNLFKRLFGGFKSKKKCDKAQA